jgi:putative YhdH/YhfP family quinone oxidoreductase
LGAKRIISRSDASDDSQRPILSGLWAGVIDTVGGNILSTALRSTQYGGAITCCGLVASPELHATVFPFILRGLRLIGIDSVLCPMPLRRQIWAKIATDWKLTGLEDVIMDCSLQALDQQIDRILEGQMRGRVVVNVSG